MVEVVVFTVGRADEYGSRSHIRSCPLEDLQSLWHNGRRSLQEKLQKYFPSANTLPHKTPDHLERENAAQRRHREENCHEHVQRSVKMPSDLQRRPVFCPPRRRRAPSLRCNMYILHIQLGTVKLSRWRHWIPVWSSLIAEKRGADTEWLRRWPRESAVSFPGNANLHASSASLKHGLRPPSFFKWSSFLAHRLVVITHAIVKLRCKKETVEWQQSTLLEKNARVRVLVFGFFHFPSVVVRSSKIEVFGVATVGRGYNELEHRHVIKTLLDAGVESTQELSERSGLCKAPNEKTKKILKWESGKRR